MDWELLIAAERRRVVHWRRYWTAHSGYLALAQPQVMDCEQEAVVESMQGAEHVSTLAIGAKNPYWRNLDGQLARSILPVPST